MSGRVKVEGLTKTFRNGPVTALNNFTFSLEPGEFAAVVGESGSGKTTLGRCLMGLVGFDRGIVEVNGFDVSRLGPTSEIMRFRKSAQMAFQNPYASLNPAFKVRSALAEAVRIHSQLPAEGVDDQVARLASLVKLDIGLLDQRPPALSGGEKRRVIFARALATSPDFIVADEPLSGLDLPIQVELLGLLKRIHERRRLTMLFISHDLRHVRMLASRVLVMHRGRLVEDAPADRFFADAGAVHPYSKLLIECGLSKGTLSGREWGITDEADGCSYRDLCDEAIVRGELCDTMPTRMVEVAHGHRVECNHEYAQAK